MNNLILIVSIIIFNGSINNCKGIKKGVFISVDKNFGETIIQRNDTIQLEENKILGTLFLQKIKWIDECNYVIYSTKALKNEADLDTSNTFTVSFKESQEKNIYYVSVLVKSTNFKHESTIEKISDNVDDDFYEKIVQ